MKKEIQRNQLKYENKYRLDPSLNAGMHCGKIIAGEVCVTKRDITFSGYVLNTTSRIQAKCKEYEVEFIVSAEVLREMHLEDKYAAPVLASLKLLGKENEIELHSIIADI